MPEEAERVKRLVEFKRRLEKRVEELASELKEEQTMLETVNSLLLEKGFKHAELPKEPVATEPPKEERASEPELPVPKASVAEPENLVPLKTVNGELLATLHISGSSLRMVPAEDKRFDVNTPPFTHFLVERVLVKMQERDNELIRAGELTTDRIFSYNVLRDGDVIREIDVRNADEARLRELKSSIRWTLEKMYEKMKTQG